MVPTNPDQFYGQGIESVFPAGGSPVRAVPFPRAGRQKHRGDYDPSIVQSALKSPPTLQQVDPRELHASQPSVTEPGVRYYAENSTWNQTGETYADQGVRSNRNPLVYRRYDNWPPGEDDKPTSILLSGHHRATAALVRGESLPAVVVDGPWGPSRGR